MSFGLSLKDIFIIINSLGGGIWELLEISFAIMKI